MNGRVHNTALKLVDDLVAEGITYFTFEEARRRFNRSPSATANLLRRMIDHGLVDRVRRGHYVIRRLGVLGTRAAAEDLAIVVAAVFAGHPHRMAYRTALDEHDLIAHSVRTVHVATVKRMRVKNLSGRTLRTVAEPAHKIRVGAMALGPSWISDLERSLLDAAARPELAGGVAVIAGAVAAADGRVCPERLANYAKQLEWKAALRRIGSIADTLDIKGLAGKLAPLEVPVADINLEPGADIPVDTAQTYRDPRWRVRWACSPAEIESVVRQ
ncbi:MAG: type IV toxin-antitoxin system AbiEi family antitoxin domain-containing protein [Deltaproteobacteria bacterium]|nr:type IV toxin-antitoxin system AbiEi family antitoxin domain-containing protein [Deltaproteobacteria bacterium]